jgi:hypothetical protein
VSGDVDTLQPCSVEPALEPRAELTASKPREIDEVHPAPLRERRKQA